MECFVLGTGGMMPMPHRRLTALLVRTQNTDVLFDAGEGVQVAFKELGLGIKRLTIVAVTHLHADHCLGLPGLLMLRSQVDDPSPLTLVGPRGLKRFVSHVRSDLRAHINFPLRYVELDPRQGLGTALQEGGLSLRWAALEHTVPCVGYRLEEPDRPGRFHPDRARHLGIPEGPLWGRLQRGEEVRLPDGRTVRPDEVLGPPRRGRAIAYVTDTRPCPNAVALCREVDLAFIEGMFLDEDLELAEEKGHMTASEAARIARDADARRLVLVHVSPRYTEGQKRPMVRQARRFFQNTVAARDLEKFQVPLTDDPPRSAWEPTPRTA